MGEEIHGREPVDPSIFREVLRVNKGSGQILGELATQARQVERELNAFLSGLEVKGIEVY